MNNVIRFLCENADKAEKKGLNVNLTSVFTFIGMAFCIIASVVALVWLTCFIVRLLIKSFKVQVQNSYEVFVENSSAKTASKKERNAIKRKASDARKMEILKMKEESRDRIHKMKTDKLGVKLNDNENKAKEKYAVGSEKVEGKPAKEKEIFKKEPEKIIKNEIKDEKSANKKEEKHEDQPAVEMSGKQEEHPKSPAEETKE